MEGIEYSIYNSANESFHLAGFLKFDKLDPVPKKSSLDTAENHSISGIKSRRESGKLKKDPASGAYSSQKERMNVDVGNQKKYLDLHGISEDMAEKIKATGAEAVRWAQL